MEHFAGDPAQLDTVAGHITRMAGDRNLWWRVTPDSPEILFSLRRDGVWRLVGGAADASGLQFVREPARV